jgi:amidase
MIRAFPFAFALAAIPPALGADPMPARFPFEEVSIEKLQADMAKGRTSSVALVKAYRQRIAAIDAKGPKLRSVIELNPDAPRIAAQLDKERKAGKVRGPLHGIPILLKDNLDTGDRMMTTAGSLALAGAPAPKDAFVVARLREAGAVILGKTNLSEWANIRSPKSSSGWSARGGQTRNPYVLDRSPCGSSSGTGTAIAASLAAVGVGTETDGSIVCPSSVAGLVGVKPTIGLVSRTGIIPISISQDSAGPMARTVTDAAILLGAMTAADPDDAAMAVSGRRTEADYRRALDKDALRGARIGVLRKGVIGYSPQADALFEKALLDLKRLGAQLVDPADPPEPLSVGQEELELLLTELKDGLARYLAGRPEAGVRTLADVIAFNERNAAKEMPHFGQEFFTMAQATGPVTDAAFAEKAARIRRLAREHLDGALAAHRLDALVAPTGAPAWPVDHVNGDHHLGGSSRAPAVAGYPNVTVPMGDVRGLPVGISFLGTAWSEPRLLGLAFAYEQGTRHRKPPRFLPTLP